MHLDRFGTKDQFAKIVQVSGWHTYWGIRAGINTQFLPESGGFRGLCLRNGSEPAPSCSGDFWYARQKLKGHGRVDR